MITDNKFIDLKCPFSTKTMSQVVETLRKLKAPYIFVTRENENDLYFIENIETYPKQVAEWWYYDGGELPYRYEDVIKLELKRIENDMIVMRTVEISFDMDNDKNNISAEEVFKQSNLKIPSEQELMKADYENGIPGHITTAIEKMEKWKAEASKLQCEIQVLQAQKEIFDGMIKYMNNRYTFYENKIIRKEDRLSELQSKIIILNNGIW